ncbi:RNA 2',3'-cyclic phosphodiesterase [Sphingomonas sp. DBB INV C78]|uniref:RNA 2',3'-cyclic phosphodiesterase n=1 Tax=Sphingomonas sp. DBB INV C78 TaxID=3349434 RepID=UPI0036D2E28C
MHRLFVALRPPRIMREALLATMGGVPGARWQDDEQLHLTLRFIGEVDRHMAEDVAAALGSVHHPRFALALNGIGQFDRAGRLDALWAGVTPHDQVTALHNKVDQALSRIGIAPDTRAFLPHITIARFSRKATPIDPLLSHFAGLGGEPQEMKDFCLYESHLGSEGAAYEIVARYPLI